MPRTWRSQIADEVRATSNMKPKVEFVCPVCQRGNNAWMRCDHPGCCDGRNLVEKEVK